MALDWAHATELNVSVIKSLDTITDNTLLYDAMLKLDSDVKKRLKVLSLVDVLHPLVFKKVETVLG